MFANVYGLTDKGMLRELNEDSFKICGFEDGKLSGICVLADGMGGHNAGEIASRMAVNLICDDLESALLDEDTKDLAKKMAASIDFANSEIYNMSLKNSAHAGMGTTTVVAFVKDDLVRIANIGDSSAFLISDTVMRKITVDHSVVEELIRSGSITRLEARNHPDKNIITRAVGSEKYVDADFYDYKVVGGETILICSDGLTEMVREKDIKRIINESENIKDALKMLIDEANRLGGVDNITVIALQFKKED